MRLNSDGEDSQTQDSPDPVLVQNITLLSNPALETFDPLPDPVLIRVTVFIPFSFMAVQYILSRAATNLLISPQLPVKALLTRAEVSEP